MSDARRGSSDMEAKRNAGTCLALAGLLFVGAGLFALAVFIMPDLLNAVVVIAIVAGLVLFHYVTWGRWLSRPRPGDLIDEDAAPNTVDPAADDFGDVD